MNAPNTPLENARCARHPETPAAILCSRCGDFACESCASANFGYCVVCRPSSVRRIDPTLRLGAVAIDGLLSSAPILFIMIVPALAAGDSNVIRYALLGVGVLGLLAYAVLQWRGVSRSGQSIGKRVMGLRVVRVSGGRASVWTILLLRNGVPMIVSAVPILGPLFALANLAAGLRSDGRCLHDHIAGTVVVRAAPRNGE